MQIPGPGRRTRRGLQAATLGAALVAMSFAVALPSAAQSDELEIDEISHSKNVTLAANLPRQPGVEDAWHSDLAFWGDYVFQGSYGGISIIDVTKPEKNAPNA